VNQQYDFTGTIASLNAIVTRLRSLMASDQCDDTQYRSFEATCERIELAIRTARAQIADRKFENAARTLRRITGEMLFVGRAFKELGNNAAVAAKEQ
jgi:hypothetical protein